MHIAIVCGEYPPRWGGIGSVVFHLAGHLVKLGHEITIITRKHEGKAPSQDGVSVVDVKWLKAPMAFTRSYGKHSIKALYKIHEEKKIDVILVMLPLVSWKRKEYDAIQQNIAPVVSSLNGSWIGEREGMKLAAKHKEAATWKNPNDLAILTTGGYYSRYEQFGIEKSAACVSNSDSTVGEFKRWYNPPSDWNVYTHLWGVDHLVFRPKNQDDEEEQLAHEKVRKRYDAADELALSGDVNTKTPLLLAVGRLVARKGYKTLLKSLPHILEKEPNARLCIVGRGHMRKTLLKQAQKLGVSHAVWIIPGMSFEELAQHFRSSDLVIYPSFYEGQGLIPLESLASGTPVVTVNQPPLTEMIDETVGDLFVRGDEKSLAEAVVRALSDRESMTAKAEKGRQRVLSKYTYEHNAEDYEKVFKSVISNN